MKTKVFKFDYAEPHPILSKDSESRMQKKQARLIFFAETHPILSKDSESRMQKKGGAMPSGKSPTHF